MMVLIKKQFVCGLHNSPFMIFQTLQLTLGCFLGILGLLLDENRRQLVQCERTGLLSTNTPH